MEVFGQQSSAIVFRVFPFTVMRMFLTKTIENMKILLILEAWEMLAANVDCLGYTGSCRVSKKFRQSWKKGCSTVALQPEGNRQKPP